MTPPSSRRAQVTGYDKIVQLKENVGVADAAFHLTRMKAKEAQACWVGGPGQATYLGVSEWPRNVQ
jgi:hypothetical protein